ncbi:MAG TPA: TolC family protein [Gemmatimonadaceae bacterium]|jgi:cobalt-zinc-cadmium efflux system outer membrane protein|nr:TolC family protein [Gemmatimonadaceae bacterium]
MRTTIGMLAVAFYASAAFAQQPILSPPAASSPDDSLRLTRQQAVAQALARNPQLEAARQQTAEARGARVQGIAFPDITASAALEDQPRVLGVGQSVGLGLDVPFPDKFRLQNNIGNAGIQAAQYSYTQLRQLIAAQTAEQYDSLLVALRHRSDLTDTRDLAQQFLQKTQARFTAGTAAKLDVIQGQVDVAQAQNQLIVNTRAIANAKAGLNRYLNRPLGAPLILMDSLTVPLALPPLSRIEPYALDHRPELANLQSQIAGARATTTLSREYWLPDLVLGASRDYTQPGPALYSAGVAFPLPLFFFQHTHGEIAQNVARERELSADAIDMRAQIGQDVRNAYAAASTALEQVFFIRDNLLPSAQAVFKSAMASYSLGGSSALEVIDARRTLVDAESQYTDALAAANMARWDLQRAAGTSLDTFGPGVTP